MTKLDPLVIDSIHHAIAIIRQGRELERLLLDAGFALPDAGHRPESSNDAAAPASEPDPITTPPEWPKPNADGELTDVRGILWDERIHASSKNCTADGAWRKKRGADPDLIERYEREALERNSAADDQEGRAANISDPDTNPPRDPHPTEDGAGEPEQTDWLPASEAATPAPQAPDDFTKSAMDGVQ